MASPEDRLEQMGIRLPEPQSPIANYVPAVRTGDFLFLSGSGPAQGADCEVTLGKLGSELNVEQGYESARLVGLNLIARLKAELGCLGRVKQVVKLLCMVNSAPDFAEQPSVANGCSDLLVEVFGDRGRHARSAVGMSSLPNNIPVEIEMIVEVERE